MKVDAQQGLHSACCQVQLASAYLKTSILALGKAEARIPEKLGSSYLGPACQLNLSSLNMFRLQPPGSWQGLALTWLQAWPEYWHKLRWDQVRPSACAEKNHPVCWQWHTDRKRTFGADSKSSAQPQICDLITIKNEYTQYLQQSQDTGVLNDTRFNLHLFQKSKTGQFSLCVPQAEKFSAAQKIFAWDEFHCNSFTTTSHNWKPV